MYSSRAGRLLLTDPMREVLDNQIVDRNHRNLKKIVLQKITFTLPHAKFNLAVPSRAIRVIAGRTMSNISTLMTNGV